MLTRRSALGLLPAAVSLSPLLRAVAAAASPLTYSLKPERLTDGIWIIRGAQETMNLSNGGAVANITIMDTKAGAVIVDTGPSHRYGDALRDMAKTLTGKPVARVYNTHFHPDHVLGNQAFPANIVAAPQGVVDGLSALGEAFTNSMYQVAGDWMRGTAVELPGTILTNEPEDFGDRKLRPLIMKGHTPCDLVLFEERSGFLICGDLVFVDRAATTPHADIERWRISLANLGGIPHSRIIPGHGPSEESDRGIDQTRHWLEEIEGTIRRAFERGLDISEAIALPLPNWTEKIALARYEYERTVMHLYPKLEAERWPRVDTPG